MPRRSDQNRHLQVLVSKETYERLHQISQESGTNLSDLVREALQIYLKEHLGIDDIDLSVNRGGRRPGSGRK